MVVVVGKLYNKSCVPSACNMVHNMQLVQIYLDLTVRLMWMDNIVFIYLSDW